MLDVLLDHFVQSPAIGIRSMACRSLVSVILINRNPRSRKGRSCERRGITWLQSAEAGRRDPEVFLDHSVEGLTAGRRCHGRAPLLVQQVHRLVPGVAHLVLDQHQVFRHSKSPAERFPLVTSKVGRKQNVRFFATLNAIILRLTQLKYGVNRLVLGVAHLAF
jgi:hypothetical protein